MIKIGARKNMAHMVIITWVIAVAFVYGSLIFSSFSLLFRNIMPVPPFYEDLLPGSELPGATLLQVLLSSLNHNHTGVR